ncbi:hypothetical protein AAHA92_30650 [Salvia divinorum]|uniref:Uncharacterized protein n=1 Tax=Salvia divinorum TaxID=28513 RepID=A0ABD1FRK8_SALDI
MKRLMEKLQSTIGGEREERAVKASYLQQRDIFQLFRASKYPYFCLFFNRFPVFRWDRLKILSSSGEKENT